MGALSEWGAPFPVCASVVGRPGVSAGSSAVAVLDSGSCTPWRQSAWCWLGWMATILILLVALTRAKPKRPHLTGAGPTAGDEMSHQVGNVQELTSPLQGTQP